MTVDADRVFSYHAPVELRDILTPANSAMDHVTASVEFQMSLLLFVSLAGYLVASRISQPAVVGEILVGMAIGPSVLGWITYTEFVSSIAHLGAVILLFVVGLEFKLRDIATLKYAIIGLFGVLVPWVCGYALALLFDFEPHRAAIIGVALTATSIAITAEALREMGWLQTEVARAIIGAAVIDDVLALIALSLVNQMMVAEAVSAVAAVAVFAKAVVFLAVGALAGQRLLTRVILRIDTSDLGRRYPELVFIFAMMVAFLYGMTAELLGLSAIVGAFVAGVALEGVGLRYSKNFKEGAEYLRIIFASVFFVSLGVLADIKALTPTIMGFTLLLTAVAIAAKVVGCGIPARLQGMSTRDSLVIGFGMAPRGEVAMIVALLALNQGVIAQSAYVALVMMALLTTITTPLVLRNWLLKGAAPA